jgi:hypothetical protein
VDKGAWHFVQILTGKVPAPLFHPNTPPEKIVLRSDQSPFGSAPLHPYRGLQVFRDFVTVFQVSIICKGEPRVCLRLGGRHT